MLYNVSTINSWVLFHYTAIFAANKRRPVYDRTNVVTGVPYRRFCGFEQFFPIFACIKWIQVVHNVCTCV